LKHRHYFLAILALVIASAWVIFGGQYPFKLGLDLKGGMRVILRAEPPAGEKLTPGLLNDAKNVIQRRVDNTGVAEPLVQTKGGNQIIVELPDIPEEKKQEALDQFQKLAMLRFVAIPDKYEVVHGEPTTFLDKVTRQQVPSSQVLQEGEVIVTGKELLPGKARGNLSVNGQTEVELRFNAEGRKKFADYTMRNVKKYFGIFLDDEPISVPIVEEPIPTGDGVIRGSFSLEEAQDLANLLNAGALPVPLRIEQVTDVGPTLGKESVDKSLVAGLIGLALVALFMIGFYRLPGIVAVVALLFYAAFSAAIFKLIPVTMTLPGIAGFILSIGMAVDANILIFERLKEELNAGKTLRAAVDAGFVRAFSSIFDSNMCSVITCAILWNFGTGPIRGFALTLAIGVIVSMFTAITCTRTMLYMLVPTSLSHKPQWWGLGYTWMHPPEGTVWRIVERWKLYFGISGALILTSIIFMGLMIGKVGSPVLPGIDFTGGSLMQLKYEAQVPTADQVRQALAPSGREESDVTISAGEKRVVIRGKHFASDATQAAAEREQIEKALAEATGKFKVEAFDNVGPTMGKDLTSQALKAILVASVLIVLYLWFRFTSLDFGLVAITTLLHDAFVILGFFAVTGYFLHWEVDSLFVTAVLTIIGYSVHDTIVVFDRIRENQRLKARGEPFELVADRSVTQTVVRSINTSLTVVFVLAALVLFGGATIREFNTAMLVGIIAGAYSTIFFASPLLTVARTYGERRKQASSRRVEEKPMVAAGGAAPRPKPLPKPQPKPIEAAVSSEDVSGPAAPAAGGSVTKVAPKPQRNIKKKKRRF